MTRTNIISLFLGFVLSAAFVFASIEFRRMTGTLASLEDRLGRAESAASPRPDASPSPGDVSQPDRHAAPATSGEVVAELTKMREEIAALRNSQPGGGSGSTGNPDGSTAGSAGGPAMSKDDLSKAVRDALVAKEKTDKEKQARMYKKQLEVSAKSWTENLSKKLDLTEQQKTKMSQIFVEQWSRMNSAWTDSGDNENAEAVDYNKVQKETNEQVKTILTPEQGAKYDEIMKKGNMWGGASSDSADSEEDTKSSR